MESARQVRSRLLHCALTVLSVFRYCSFACGCTWVWNLVFYVTVGRAAEERLGLSWGTQHSTGEDCTMRSFTVRAAQSNNIQGIKSTRKRWVGHVARMGDNRNVYSVLVARHKGRKPLGEDLGADGMMVLKLKFFMCFYCAHSRFQ